MQYYTTKNCASTHKIISMQIEWYNRSSLEFVLVS